jgi:plastocyanin
VRFPREQDSSKTRRRSDQDAGRSRRQLHRVPYQAGNMFRFKTQWAVVSLAVALLGCGGGYGSMTAPPPPPPPANTVAATNGLVFTPSTLHIAAGETVTFTFGSVAHNVFFAARTGVPADIPGNNANDMFDRQFTTAGTYTYACHIHPGMQGSVVVQ